jgi:LicD family
MNLRILVATCAFLFTVPTLAKQQEGAQVPTDFVRDTMQPMGIPFLSTYHAIRENIFLNTKATDESPLEAIGNFFLIPSQYLFAGKKITSECKTSQRFTYGTLWLPKTLASIAALPVSQVLGATFKGLAHLSKDVRHKHRALKTALKSSPLTCHREDYERQGLPPFHTDAFIPCQEHKRPSHLTKKQKIEIEALKEVIALLEAHNIIYWIDCGTCLGAFRYGGIIPWDWDIDISILLADHDNAKKILSTLDPEKYQIQDWSSYSKPKTFLKLLVKETKNFIDIYHYQINEQDKTVNYLFTYFDSPFPLSWKIRELKCIKPLNYEAVFPLKRAKFDTLTLWAPGDVVTFLQSKYGDNLEPTMVWDEKSQTYHKVENHPYYK